MGNLVVSGIVDLLVVLKLMCRHSFKTLNNLMVNSKLQTVCSPDEVVYLLDCRHGLYFDTQAQLQVKTFEQSLIPCSDTKNLSYSHTETV